MTWKELFATLTDEQKDFPALCYDDRWECIYELDTFGVVTKQQALDSMFDYRLLVNLDLEEGQLYLGTSSWKVHHD